MLNLVSETDPDWGRRAVEDLDDVLIDHAHCEKKAASTALSILFRYPQKTPLLEPLSRLAREELSHFELMLGVLNERGIAFGRQRPSTYAGRLMAGLRTDDPERLMDLLLACAYIEARSTERMRLLSEATTDDGLRQLYRGLLAAEARHHRLYVDLAEQVFSRDEVQARMREVGQIEAEAIAAAEFEQRMHGGCRHENKRTQTAGRMDSPLAERA
jgi:tRNA 2-(methylsulfanyl)-N6-isopentenyladenosine37 hydroxylase